MHPTQAVENFGNISMPFVTLAFVDIHRKFYGDRPTGIPLPGELNARGVAKYSDFGLIEGYISETVQGRGKLVLITNRKSYMSFRSVPKSVTLNDLKRRNGPYFALFHQIRVRCRKTIIRPIPRFQNLLLIVYDHINTICAII